MKCTTGQLLSIRYDTLLFALLLPILTASTALGGETSVLVVSSDQSIKKYSYVQSVFQAKLDRPMTILNMGKGKPDPKKVANAINKEDPGLIYSIGAKAYVSLLKTGEKRPIVFSSLLKWRRFPLGEKTYGVASELPIGMQLMIYRYFFPKVKRIGVLYSATYNKKWVAMAIEEARDLGIEIVVAQVSEPKDTIPALEKITDQIDALWLTADPVVLSGNEMVQKLFRMCDLRSKPVFAYGDAFASLGATLMISADLATTGRQVASLADDIFEGRVIFEKVQNPAGSYITLNQKMVERYGLFINIDAMDSVNRIIE